MERQDVYKAIDSERDYQEEMTRNEFRPDMISDLHLGDTIAAMQYNLDLARVNWYQGAVPHTTAMEFIRKVCALGVQIAEKQGMPSRSIYPTEKP